jgi:hypothetical protein
MSDALSGALCVLAVIGGLTWRRPGHASSASTAPASSHALLITLAFVAWRLPDVLLPNGPFALCAGGVLAALWQTVRTRAKRGTPARTAERAPLHLAAAGGCAALAYAVGVQPGALAVLAVVAMIGLIGAHLALALGGAACAAVASLMSAIAAAGLAIDLAVGGTHGALAVASVLLAIGCARSVSFAGIAREAP